MSGYGGVVVILLVVLFAIIAWWTWQAVYSKSHPGAPSPQWATVTRSLMRSAGNIPLALAIGAPLFVMLWPLLSWSTQALDTGHWPTLAGPSTPSAIHAGSWSPRTAQAPSIATP